MSKPHAFDLEQALFHGQTAAETANGAVAGDDAMARNDNGNWIRAAGHPDGARGPGFADLLRDPTVRPCFAARDCSQRTPDGLLESCARGEIEGNGPVHESAGGILLELTGKCTDERGRTLTTLPPHLNPLPRRGEESGSEWKIDAGDAVRRILDATWAKFRADDYRITNQMIHSATKDNPSHMKKRLRSRRWARLSGL